MSDPNRVLYESVRKGLEYMEDPDKAIGKDGYGEDGQMIESLVALNRLLFAWLLENRVPNTKTLQNRLAVFQTMELTVAHNLYAAGVKKGRAQCGRL